MRLRSKEQRGGNKVAYFPQSILHRDIRLDSVTVGNNNVRGSLDNNFAAIMDVAGFNYHNWMYPEAYEKLPQGLILGAETILNGLEPWDL